MKSDYEILKKYYGENFAKKCRSLFPTILEQPNLLANTITKTFAPSHFLYDDIVKYNDMESFKGYIYKILPKQDIQKAKSIKSPTELLSMAGYDLYKCESHNDVLKFEKYYTPNELICTFIDEERTKDCHVFFAIKKDVDNIKRNDFKNPQRDDLYGTSVISIQFSKSFYNYLSIKNRYNHTVENPDATFGNNLENIIPGLTESFEKYYGLNLSVHSAKEFHLPNYLQANDGKYYKYNYFLNNVYYCPNNILIKDGEVTQLDKDRYDLLDYFIFDKKNKSIIYNNPNPQSNSDAFSFSDGFVSSFGQIEKIESVKEKDGNKLFTITNSQNEQIFLTVDKKSRIIKYTNDFIKIIDDNFFKDNLYLQEFNSKSVQIIGNNFLYRNKNLDYIDIPNCTTIKNSFLHRNDCIKSINLPNVHTIKSRFLYQNKKLNYIYAPNLTNIENSFLFYNFGLLHIDLPKLKTVESSFLHNNKKLYSVNLPNLQSAGHYFLNNNQNMLEIDLPSLKNLGDYALANAVNLQNFKADNVKTIGKYFLQNNTIIDKLQFNYDKSKSFLDKFLNF